MSTDTTTPTPSTPEALTLSKEYAGIASEFVPSFDVARNGKTLSQSLKYIERGPTRGAPFYSITVNAENIMEVMEWAGTDEFIAIVQTALNKKGYNWTDQAVDMSPDIKDAQGNVTEGVPIKFDLEKLKSFIADFSATSESKDDLEEKREKLLTELQLAYSRQQAAEAAVAGGDTTQVEAHTKAAGEVKYALAQIGRVTVALNAKKRTRKPKAEVAA